MTGSMLSSTWYRVADLKPRLRTHARMHRHRYRGEIWYLLQDAVSSRVHRFTPAARLVIAAMDGQRSVAALWELANRRLGEDAPTQDDMIQLLGQLHSADLLQSDVTPDAAEAFDRGETQQRAERRRSWFNPMALRLHLWDPDAALNRARPFIDALWSRWGGIAWLAAVLPALVLLPLHWPELTGNFSDRVLAVDNLLLLWLLFPVIKALHELGHAVATKRGGGEVHDMGVVMLVMIPVPYVEASAATVFTSKWERAMVGAAGMAVELFVAAVAFHLWRFVEPGVTRAVLFNVMLVAGVSTLVFNGNPLLRYDAYYILADVLEIPNLANRATRYWGWLIERYAFGVTDARAADASRAEQAWFVVYGAASSVYRVLVTIGIALFMANAFFFVGIALALWAVVAMALWPLLRAFRHLNSPSLGVHRRRAIAVTLGVVGALLLVVLAVPMPHRSSAEGVVWLPEQSVARAGHDGFVDRIVATPGAAVHPGDLLFLLSDPQMDEQIAQAEARVAELDAQWRAQSAIDRAGAGVALEQLERERDALAAARERARGLAVHAKVDGTFVVDRPNDLPGRHVARGEALGHVIEPGSPLIRVVVPQESVDLVRGATRGVSVRLAHRPEQAVAARIVRQVPQGGDLLPSRALAADGGGQIATDPRDAKGMRSLERTFQLDVALEPTDPASPAPAFFGERAHLRFDHPPEPLGQQWYRGVRRLFLSHFQL